MDWSLDSTRDFLFFLLHVFLLFFLQELEWIETGNDGEGGTMEAGCPCIALPSWGPSPEIAKTHPCLELHPSLPSSSEPIKFPLPNFLKSGPQHLASFYNPLNTEEAVIKSIGPSLEPGGQCLTLSNGSQKVVFQVPGEGEVSGLGFPNLGKHQSLS